MAKRPILAGWVVLLVACGADSEPADAGFTVRDSAGITIVESFEPAWGEGEGWTLSPEPILDIGVVEGDPEYLLSGVEDVARRPDGQVVVVNRRPLEIRVYDGEGRFLRSVGQEGEGPGEFLDIYGVILRPADETAVVSFPQRLTTFGPSGAVVEEVSLPVLGQRLGQPSAFADGSFIVPWRMESEFELQAAGGVRLGETVRPRVALVLHGPEGLPRDTIGVFPGGRAGNDGEWWIDSAELWPALHVLGRIERGLRGNRGRIRDPGLHPGWHAHPHLAPNGCRPAHHGRGQRQRLGRHHEQALRPG